ncbi:MAG: glycosyltransferase family 9 protein [Bdellovibrionota bacterium]
MNRILVIRPDRIGDVVLSTPVIEALKQAQPSLKVDFLVRDAVVPVVERHSLLEKVVAYRPASTHRGFAGFWRLVRELKQARYDAAVVLQVNFLVSLALLFARISLRVGPYSKWYSFFFFNAGVRQNRSAVEMHESDYCLMLLRKLGVETGSRRFESKIIVDADARNRVQARLKETGLESARGFVIVHPGMGGSALNWPEQYYADLVQRLAAKGVQVVVSGSALEKGLVERTVSAAKERNPTLPIFSFLGTNSHTGLADYIALISLSKMMVAPSTGPLHIAVALGKPTVSFYPPIKVQSAHRWGPYAKDGARHSVLVPDAPCEQDFKCAGPKCDFYFCMERLSVDKALESVLLQLENVK